MSSLIVNRGSDATFTLTWTDSSGDPIDLSDRAVVVFDEASASRSGPPASEIQGRITGQVVDGPNGVVELHLEGTEFIRVGKYVFRVQLNKPVPGDPGDQVDSISTPLINLEIR